MHSPHPHRNGFLWFSRKRHIFGKNCNTKNNRNLITRKKGYIRFHRQMHPSLRRGLGPLGNSFSPFSRKICFFFAKTVGKWISLSYIFYIFQHWNLLEMVFYKSFLNFLIISTRFCNILFIISSRFLEIISNFLKYFIPNFYKFYSDSLQQCLLKIPRIFSSFFQNFSKLFQ